MVIIRTILPQFLATLFDVRLLRRIKALAKKDIDGKLIWVTDPSGMDFLENENLLNLASTFTSKARSMCALGNLFKASKNSGDIFRKSQQRIPELLIRADNEQSIQQMRSRDRNHRPTTRPASEL